MERGCKVRTGGRGKADSLSHPSNQNQLFWSKNCCCTPAHPLGNVTHNNIKIKQPAEDLRALLCQRSASLQAPLAQHPPAPVLRPPPKNQVLLSSVVYNLAEKTPSFRFICMPFSYCRLLKRVQRSRPPSGSVAAATFGNLCGHEWEAETEAAAAEAEASRSSSRSNRMMHRIFSHVSRECSTSAFSNINWK